MFKKIIIFLFCFLVPSLLFGKSAKICIKNELPTVISITFDIENDFGNKKRNYVGLTPIIIYPYDMSNREYSYSHVNLPFKSGKIKFSISYPGIKSVKNQFTEFEYKIIDKDLKTKKNIIKISINKDIDDEILKKVLTEDNTIKNLEQNKLSKDEIEQITNDSELITKEKQDMFNNIIELQSFSIALLVTGAVLDGLDTIFAGLSTYVYSGPKELSFLSDPDKNSLYTAAFVLGSFSIVFAIASTVIFTVSQSISTTKSNKMLTDKNFKVSKIKFIIDGNQNMFMLGINMKI
jgi:hypothetical protein